MRTWTRILAGLVTGLLALEGAYFIWAGVFFYRLYLHAENHADVAVPAAVWQDGFIGLLLVVGAGAYARNVGLLRPAVAALSPLLLLKGASDWWSSRSFHVSLWNVSDLDLFACSLAAEYVLILIGVLAPLCWWLGRRGSGGTRGSAPAP